MRTQILSLETSLHTLLTKALAESVPQLQAEVTSLQEISQICEQRLRAVHAETQDIERLVRGRRPLCRSLALHILLLWLRWTDTAEPPGPADGGRLGTDRSISRRRLCGTPFTSLPCLHTHSADTAARLVRQADRDRNAPQQYAEEEDVQMLHDEAGNNKGDTALVDGAVGGEQCAHR